jgi:DNA-binding transcriptional LysR family regulator
MNLDQMIYIKAIVETKSMSLAAKKLYVSQSAISQSIASLERKIGIQLFKRSRFGTFPTEEGASIIKKVLEALKKMDEIDEEVQSVTSSYSGELRIATIPILFLTVLPKIIAAFKKDFPQINVTIIELESKDVIEKITLHEVDLGLIALPKQLPIRLPEKIKFQSFHIHNEVNIIVPRHSPLAYNKRVHLEDIVGYPFVIYLNSFWQNVIDDIENEFGPINVIFTTSNSEVVKRTVAAGLGISLLSSLMLKDDPFVESQRIIAIPFAEYNFNVINEYGWTYSKENSHYRLIKKFLEYIHIDH